MISITIDSLDPADTDVGDSASPASRPAGSPGPTSVDRREQIRSLVTTAAAADGFSALNEAALLALNHSSADVVHLLATDETDAPSGESETGDLVGYAQLGQGEPTSTAQLLVHPERRREGIGTTLLDRLTQESNAPLQIWAMGDSPAAQALATKAGLTRARELLIMKRPLSDLPPLPPVPADIELRTFVPGQDDESWLALNAKAFVHHPEQGQMTSQDLADRMAEDWFDPAGFFLAVREGHLVGFHWTKQHPDHLGEVYVLGVDPAAAGAGLGKILLARGLAHLAEQHNTDVLLYVEGDHDRAVGLYTKAGFDVHNRDVMYAQPTSSADRPTPTGSG